MPRETSLVRRAAEALRKVASKPDGLVQRVSDKWALPQLWHYLKINALTHPRGMEQFLKYGYGHLVYAFDKVPSYFLTFSCTKQPCIGPASATFWNR